MPVKRKKTAVLITLAAVVALIVVGAAALDGWARGHLADQIAQQVGLALDVGPEAPVTVEVGGFSVIAQLVAGRFDEVSVDVDRFDVGELTGTLRLAASGVPVDTTRPVDTVRVTFTVDQNGVQKALGGSSAEKVSLAANEIRVSSTTQLLGVRFSVGLGLQPSARDGQIVFTPTSVELDGTRTSSEELRGRFGALADTLLQVRSFCVARWLPEALTLDGARVVDGRFVVSMGADRVILSGALARLGSCPAG